MRMMEMVIWIGDNKKIRLFGNQDLTRPLWNSMLLLFFSFLHLQCNYLMIYFAFCLLFSSPMFLFIYLFIFFFFFSSTLHRLLFAHPAHIPRVVHPDTTTRRLCKSSVFNVLLLFNTSPIILAPSVPISLSVYFFFLFYSILLCSFFFSFIFL